MRRYGRIALIVLIVGCAAAVGGWYFAVWAARGAFEGAKHDIGALSGVVEAAVASTASKSDARLDMGETSAPGAMAYAQAHPEWVQEDRANFRTWMSALRITEAAKSHAAELSSWRNSRELDWIAHKDANDAWNHPFCVRGFGHEIVIVSAGPKSLAPLQCRDMVLSNTEVANMRQAKLNPHPSGALVLVSNIPAQKGQ